MHQSRLAELRAIRDFAAAHLGDHTLPATLRGPLTHLHIEATLLVHALEARHLPHRPTPINPVIADRAASALIVYGD